MTEEGVDIIPQREERRERRQRRRERGEERVPMHI
jgi:hypothetical protein